MGNMNKYLIYILLLITVGCSHFNPYRDKSGLSKDELIVNEIIAKTARHLKKEKGLQPCGTGAQMMDEVKMLALSFDYNKPLEIEEGRKLIVYAVETFVSMINSDERIHPYLYNYPFEPKNVEVAIFIKNPDRSSIEPEKLCLISVIKGILEYDVHDAKTSHLKTIYEETFVEAQKKMN